MNREELVKQLAEVLSDNPAAVTETTTLEDLSDWDSMGQMEVVSILDQINVNLESGALEKCKTVADILQFTNL